MRSIPLIMRTKIQCKKSMGNLRWYQSHHFMLAIVRGEMMLVCW